MYNSTDRFRPVKSVQEGGGGQKSRKLCVRKYFMDAPYQKVGRERTVKRFRGQFKFFILLRDSAVVRAKGPFWAPCGEIGDKLGPFRFRTESSFADIDFKHPTGQSLLPFWGDTWSKSMHVVWKTQRKPAHKTMEEGANYWIVGDCTKKFPG